MTNIKNLIKNTADKLICSDAPETDAYELVKYVFGLSKNDILISPERELDKNKLNRFDALVEKRAGGYPLQYIIGEWDFYGYTFKVNEGVLIPRPETEQIVYEANKFLKNKKNAVVFDLCTGSGCIGLSVAANNPQCKVYLFDISPAALDCSRENTALLSLENVTVLDCDIFSGFNGNLPLPDVILSNPPYVTEEEFVSLQREIFFEPKEAIVAEGDGLCFYRAICEKWLPKLKNGGFYMLESGEGQPESICSIIEDIKGFSFEIQPDLYGVDRFVSGTKE
ncbi:MAG: peptide chain release factor N(5)-glutamine methyltransferase [Clostridia bacterium]|nr:peptide chain release factor N(5)-glutamine methyltransferase [Clostridia bacterium]